MTVKIEKPSLEKIQPIIIPSHLAQKRILIIDPYQTSRAILLKLLAGKPFWVTAVDSAQEGFGQLPGKRAFDLFMVDWEIISESGLNFLNQLKKQNGNTATPIIIMTKPDRMPVIQMKTDAKAPLSYLIKPIFKLDVLIHEIMEAFGVSALFALQTAVGGKKEQTLKKAFAGTRLLLAEDNIINQHVAAELLGSYGFEVTIADNGKEAVDFVCHAKEGHPFRAVIMDLQIPEMDGFEATRRIRDDGRFGELPIIALTAQSFVEEREAVIRAGMNDFLEKPIQPEQLLAMLGKWIPPSPPAVETKNSVAQRPVASFELPGELPGIKVSGGISQLAGNQELYFKLLKAFYEYHLNTVGAIRTQLHRGNLTAAGQIVHSMKGISGNIGAQELYRNCIALENAINGGDDGEILRIIDQFETAFKIVTQSISGKGTIPSSSGKVGQRTDRRTRKSQSAFKRTHQK